MEQIYLYNERTGQLESVIDVEPIEITDTPTPVSYPPSAYVIEPLNFDDDYETLIGYAHALGDMGYVRDSDDDY